MTVDTSKLPVHKKHVRPVSMQDTMESRRLWHHVTESLCQDDTDKATEHKRIVSRVRFTGVELCSFHSNLNLNLTDQLVSELFQFLYNLCLYTLSVI